MVLGMGGESARASICGLALAASAFGGCAGEANLGSDVEPDDRWSRAAESEADADGITTIYRGERRVLDFTVVDGTIYVLLGGPQVFDSEMELSACSVEACQHDRRTLWRAQVPFVSAFGLSATTGSS